MSIFWQMVQRDRNSASCSFHVSCAPTTLWGTTAQRVVGAHCRMRSLQQQEHSLIFFPWDWAKLTLMPPTKKRSNETAAGLLAAQNSPRGSQKAYETKDAIRMVSGTVLGLYSLSLLHFVSIGLLRSSFMLLFAKDLSFSRS